MQKKSLETGTGYADVSKINLMAVPATELKTIFDLQIAMEDLLLSNVQLEASASGKLHSTVAVFSIMMLALLFHARPQIVFALACIVQVTLITIDRIAIYGISKLRSTAYEKYTSEIARLEKKYPV